MTAESDEIRRMQMLLDALKDLRIRHERINRPVGDLDSRIKALSEAIDRMRRAG